MALGVPYAVTDIPAYREVTAGGVGGALFPAGDDAALADRLRTLLGDTAARDALTRAGREHAGRYQWASVADDTASVLAEVVAQRGARRRGRGGAGSTR
jgi:phosphatidylinositol alpha-mannosyltransferase